MAIIYIGLTDSTLEAMPDPKLQGLIVRLQDLDGANSSRTASGMMVRDRIAGGATAKRKLEIQWPPMYTPEVSKVLKAISEPFFLVRYPDPYEGGWRIGAFYAGDRSVPAYGGQTPEGMLWEGLEVNLIER